MVKLKLIPTIGQTAFVMIRHLSRHKISLFFFNSTFLKTILDNRINSLFTFADILRPNYNKSKGAIFTTLFLIVMNI